MIKKIELGFNFSHKLLQALISTTEPEKVKSIKKKKSENRAFIEFKNQAVFESSVDDLSRLLSSHGVDYQVRESAPFGIHIKNYSEQTQALYSAYEIATYATCEKSLAALPEYHPGSQRRGAFGTEITIPGVVSQEPHVLEHLKKHSLLTYASISEYLKNHLSLSPMALLLLTETLYRDGKKTESFAWHLVAMFRIKADAEKCTDKSCQGSASQVSFTFPQQFPDIFDKWVTDRKADKDYPRLAAELYEKHPQTNHQPNWLADKGMANFLRAERGVSVEEERFHPEAKCIEIEAKTLEAIRKHADDQAGPPPAYSAS